MRGTVRLYSCYLIFTSLGCVMCMSMAYIYTYVYMLLHLLQNPRDLNMYNIKINPEVFGFSWDLFLFAFLYNPGGFFILMPCGSGDQSKAPGHVTDTTAGVFICL